MDQTSPTPPPSPEFVALAILADAAMRSLPPDQRPDMLARIGVAIDHAEAAPHGRDDELEQAMRDGVAWTRGLLRSLTATFGSS